MRLAESSETHCIFTCNIPWNLQRCISWACWCCSSCSCGCRCSHNWDRSRWDGRGSHGDCPGQSPRLKQRKECVQSWKKFMHGSEFCLFIYRVVKKSEGKGLLKCILCVSLDSSLFRARQLRFRVENFPFVAFISGCIYVTKMGESKETHSIPI